MIDLSTECIFSGSTENLNTTMVVTVDGTKYKVAISEEYEDEAVPSRIKALVASKADERESKMDQLKKLAEELGIPLQAMQTQTGLSVVTQPPQSPPAPVVKPQQGLVRQNKPLPDPSTMEKVGNFRVQKNQRKNQAHEGLTPEEAERALEQAAQRSKGEGTTRPTAREAPRFPSIQLPSKVGIRDAMGNVVEGTKPVNMAQKKQVVRGRAGIPVSLPKSITARSGNELIETIINVVDNGGDAELQRRFKDFRYEAQCNYADECPTCRGVGLTRDRKDKCKRCDGKGILYF